MGLSFACVTGTCETSVDQGVSTNSPLKVESKLRRMSLPRQSNVKEAFKESFNTLGLASVAAASMALLTPIPLLIGIVAEAAYLLFVPDSKWYNDRLEAKYDNEVSQRRERLKAEILPTVTDEVRGRYGRLERLRGQMVTPTFQGKKVYRAVLRKLDYLLEKFLLFASKQVQFQQYLVQVLAEVMPMNPGPPPVSDANDRSKKNRAQPVMARATFDDDSIKTTVSKIQASYQAEIEKMQQQIGSQEYLHNQALLEKRVEILTRRSEYVARIGDILSNLQHQLDLMEDTFGLINDEIRARSPEQMLADIDDVVLQTDNLTEALQEVAPFDQAQVEDGADKLYNVQSQS